MNATENDQALQGQYVQARTDFEHARANVARLQKEYADHAAAQIELGDVEAHVARGTALQDAIADAQKAVRHARERYLVLDDHVQPALRRSRRQHAAELSREITEKELGIAASERQRVALLEQVKQIETAATAHRKRIEEVNLELSRIRPRTHMMRIAIPTADHDVPPPGVLLSVRTWADFLTQMRVAQHVNVTAVIDETLGTISRRKSKDEDV